MDEYLRSTEIINWHQPNVLELARRLAAGTPEITAKQCFEWVRDEIRHSGDYQLNPVTCSASEVIEAGTGYCYAKSHLLAALLRANSIPAGLCYQRLSISGEGPPFCLHGLNAVFLPDAGWYRIDARGNKDNVNAQFSPPKEQLAFTTSISDELDLPNIYTDPLPQVVLALRSHKSFDALAA
jgi:transglutaminase-like putative cysteine protease